MSADITVLHSDDFGPEFLAGRGRGYYVCSIRFGLAYSSDGPYPTYETAIQAMLAGVWLHSPEHEPPVEIRNVHQ